MTLSAKATQALSTARQGGIVPLDGFLTTDVPAIPFSQQAGGPQFLLSDDPEYFRVPEGVGMREVVKPGVVRAYIYHVNGLEGSTRRITTVLDNLGSAPMSVKFLRYAFAGPNKNYHAVGKKGLVDFFKSKPQRPVRRVEPGQSIVLDPAMEAVKVEYDELVHGFYEFEVDQPARVTALQTDSATPGTVAAARLAGKAAIKRKTNAGRGYFPFCDYALSTPASYVLDSAEGPAQVLIADGVGDRWITGHDGGSTSPASALSQNAGNYGVIYTIRITRRSSDGRGLALVTWNPRSADQWCGGLANAITVSKGLFPAGLVEVPAGDDVLRGSTDAVLLQVFPPVKGGKTDTIEIVYSPPGASCLPTPLTFIPIDLGPKR